MTTPAIPRRPFSSSPWKIPTRLPTTLTSRFTGVRRRTRKFPTPTLPIRGRWRIHRILRGRNLVREEIASRCLCGFFSRRRGRLRVLRIRRLNCTDHVSRGEHSYRGGHRCECHLSVWMSSVCLLLLGMTACSSFERLKQTIRVYVLNKPDPHPHQEAI